MLATLLDSACQVLDGLPSSSLAVSEVLPYLLPDLDGNMLSTWRQGSAHTMYFEASFLAYGQDIGVSCSIRMVIGGSFLPFLLESARGYVMTSAVSTSMDSGTDDANQAIPLKLLCHLPLCQKSMRRRAKSGWSDCYSGLFSGSSRSRSINGRGVWV